MAGKKIYSADLLKFVISSELVSNLEQYLPVIQFIQDSLPMIKADSNSFMETQPIDNICHSTPIGNLRQILIEINKLLQALREAQSSVEKKKIEVKKLRKRALKEADPLELELIQIEINDVLSSVEISNRHITSTVRKVSDYIVQYKSIMDSMNVISFDEIDFEKEEEKHHIMTAFSKALTAARARGGMVDEENHIYFMRIGINGASAQREIFKYLEIEGQMLQADRDPTHEMVLSFLNNMVNKYSGCLTRYARSKGIN